jgi:hypothetical protein
MGIFMKIFFTASAAALILGLSVFTPSATVKAALPTGYCPTLYADCKVGDQEACALYNSECTGVLPGSIVSGMPSAKSSGKSERD